MRSLLFVAPILLVCTPFLYSQSSSDSALQGDGQSTTGQSLPSGCTDTSSTFNTDCVPSQEQRPSSNNYQSGMTGMTDTRIRTLGSSADEGATQDGQSVSGTRPTPQQSILPLPPDPPTEFQRFVAATTGQMLPIYGANLFRRVPSTFSPNNLAPASPGYVIQPEDELRIRIWGQINYSGNLPVDRSGNIYLPQVGSIHVAGQPFSTLDLHLRQAVGRTFRNFDLSVDLGRIRSVQIYVTGQAHRPGVYTVSALSTLVDALFASGGPAPQGSLRHILLKREGKTVADFDLYALLIHGDKSHDVQLFPEDVLYIPPAGAQVAITGSIRIPGIYELRESETVGDLIDAAGKTSTVASNTRISIDRLDRQQYRQTMDVTFDVAGFGTPLIDGDILRIFPTVPAYQKTVTIRGNVANPGRVSWHEGMHLSDLMPDKASLLSRDYWWKRSHLGLPSLEFEPVVSAIGQDGLVPMRQQRPSLAESLAASGATGPQGGTQVNSDSWNQNASSENPNTLQTNQNAPQSVSNNNQSRGSGSLAAQPSRDSGDTSSTTKRNTVRLTAPEINWKYAVIERTDPETLKTSLIPFDLGKLVLEHDASQNLALQPGDAVTIFSQTDIHVPLDQQTKYVYLEGEFVHSGIYSVQSGETLRDIVRRAGGLTGNAYLYGSEFTRESTRRLQQQRLDEYVQSVSMDSERGTQELAIAGSGSSSNSSATVAASREVEQQLVARLSQIHATGRIVLQFHPENMKLDDVPALALENGDHFTVPSLPATINVVGAVYNQNSFLYMHGKTVGYYLNLAGGANRNADKRQSFVIRADGSVVGRPMVKNTFGVFGGNGFEQLRLNPGDSLVVPDKTLRPTALRGFMDWTQVFSQLALGAAAINVL